MSSFKFLTAEYGNSGVVVVRLARPPVNAIDRDMYIDIAREPEYLSLTGAQPPII